MAYFMAKNLTLLIVRDYGSHTRERERGGQMLFFVVLVPDQFVRQNLAINPTIMLNVLIHAPEHYDDLD